MASNVYGRSLIWLVSLGGIGYGLMKVTLPSEDKLKQIRNTTHSASLTDDQQKKLMFMKRMRQAAGEQDATTQKTRKEQSN